MSHPDSHWFVASLGPVAACCRAESFSRALPRSTSRSRERRQEGHRLGALGSSRKNATSSSRLAPSRPRRGRPTAISSLAFIRRHVSRLRSDLPRISPISRRAASSPVGPPSPIGSELRFGMNAGAPPSALRSRTRLQGARLRTRSASARRSRSRPTSAGRLRRTAPPGHDRIPGERSSLRPRAGDAFATKAIVHRRLAWTNAKATERSSRARSGPARRRTTGSSPKRWRGRRRSPGQSNRRTCRHRAIGPRRKESRQGSPWRCWDWANSAVRRRGR